MPSCRCCVGGRDEQQANQPAPIWGGMDGSCFFFCPIITVSFFLFFWARIAGTKFRQEDTIQGTKFRQEDTIQGTKSDKETCRSGSHSGCGTFVNSIGEEIWLSGSDQPIPGANEFKATGCAALTLISGYARLSEDRPAAEGYADRALGGRSGCLDQFINHLARPAPSPARRKRPS